MERYVFIAGNKDTADSYQVLALMKAIHRLERFCMVSSLKVILMPLIFICLASIMILSV